MYLVGRVCYYEQMLQLKRLPVSLIYQVWKQSEVQTDFVRFIIKIIKKKSYPSSTKRNFDFHDPLYPNIDCINNLTKAVISKKIFMPKTCFFCRNLAKCVIDGAAYKFLKIIFLEKRAVQDCVSIVFNGEHLESSKIQYLDKLHKHFQKFQS